jgi:plasmid maintenance system antidote protein VapI
MATDISADKKIVQTLEDCVRQDEEAKANVAVHIQIHYWFDQSNGLKLAALTGLKPNQIHSYASGRRRCPREKAAKIAHVLGMSPEELYRTTEFPDAASVGQRLQSWLAEKKLTPMTAAQKMQTSAGEFIDVVEGKRLPSAGQVMKISSFFARNFEEILGIKRPARQESAVAQPPEAPPQPEASSGAPADVPAPPKS